MELKRKVYEKLVQWKRKQNGRTAVMLEGARRVGKSYLAVQFAQKEYRSHLLIDFSFVSAQVKDVFEHDIHDLDLFFQKLSILYNKTLYRGESLIIFDEVQLYPPARQLIKHLVADGRYHYLETGSLITLKQNVQNILIPSEEETIEMFPLDFEEFLWACGDGMDYDFVRSCFDQRKPLGAAIHRKMMGRFREYMLVGGMPQAVVRYMETRTFAEADIEKRRILKLYRDDVSKFAKGYESRVLAIFDGLPSQLSQHEKRYTLSSLQKNARYRDYENAFLWLDDAKIVNTAFNTTDPSVGLALNADRLTMKCYLHDTGLLFCHTFSESEMTEEDIYKSILFDKLNLNEGMFMENVVAQMLRTNGHRLFFYSRSSRDDAADRMEIDFLIRRNRRISPIEVKSSDYRTHHSLDKFKAKFGKKIGESYIVYTKDYASDGETTCIPVYMVLCL